MLEVICVAKLYKAMMTNEINVSISTECTGTTCAQSIAVATMNSYVLFIVDKLIYSGKTLWFYR